MHGLMPVGAALVSNSLSSARHQPKLQDHGHRAGVSRSCLFTSQLSLVPIYTAW